MSDGVAATFGPVPGAVLTANTDELWLKGNRGDFRIPRSAVVKIGRGGFYPWFFRGVGIRNNVKGFPAFLQFTPMDGKDRAIRDQLKSLGFPSA